MQNDLSSLKFDEIIHSCRGTYLYSRCVVTYFGYNKHIDVYCIGIFNFEISSDHSQ